MTLLLNGGLYFCRNRDLRYSFYQSTSDSHPSVLVLAAHVVADQPAEAGSDEDIRRKMVQTTDAGKADCCGHAVTGNPDPLFIWILIRHCRSECPGRNCMA